MGGRVKGFEIVLEFFSHREAGNPSDPEKGPLRAKTGAGPNLVTSDSNPTPGLSFFHKFSSWIPFPFILRMSGTFAGLWK